MKRTGVGNLAGTGDLACAFGLEPPSKQKSGFEDSPSRAVTAHVLGGRSSTRSMKSSDANVDSPKEDMECISPSMPALAERMDLSRELKSDDEDGIGNVIGNFESFMSESSEGSRDEGQEREEKGAVINPLFTGDMSNRLHGPG